MANRVAAVSPSGSGFVQHSAPWCGRNLTSDEACASPSFFRLISTDLPPTVRARTLMLETIHPAQVLTTRGCRRLPGTGDARRHALGSRRTKVGKLFSVHGLARAIPHTCSVVLPSGVPSHVDQGRRLLSARHVSANEGAGRPA